MVSIGQRIINGSVDSLKNIPLSVVGNAILGFIYAKFADLPPGQVAKAFVIWGVAQETLSILAENLIENKTAQNITVTVIESAGTYIGITEMRKRGLMGDKLMYFFIAIRVISLLNTLSDLAGNQQQQQVNAPAT